MGLTILVVDDQPEDRKVIATLLLQEPALAARSVRVVEARDGVEGLELFARELPHLVITDLSLPRSDGFKLCHDIRELPKGRDVPLLVVSGVHKDVAVAKQLMDNFGANLLPKPIQPRRLVAKVLELIRPVGSGSSPRRGGADAADSTDAPPVEPVPIGAIRLGPPRLRNVPAPVDLCHPLRTTLDKHPLPWLLIQAAAASVTGSLRLARGKVRRVIYLVQGNPVYVDSNLRSETLGHYLVSKRVITDEQLASALKQARATSGKLGETLVSMGITDEATVREGLLGQIRLKLVNAMRWPDGAASFMPGDDFTVRVPQCSVDAAELALLLLKKTSAALGLRSQWERHGHQAIRLTPMGERFRPTIERTFGTSMLRQLLTGMPLRDALRNLPDPAALLVLLEALWVTGLIELAEAAPATIVLEAAPGKEPSAPSELRDLDPTTARRQSGVIELDELELCDPNEQPPPHAMTADSGEVSIPSVDDLELEAPAPGNVPDIVPQVSRPPETQQAPPSSPPAAHEQSTEVPEAERLHQVLLAARDGLPEKNLYQVLELAPDAGSAQVDEAYRQMLTRLTPDRLSADLAADPDKATELAAIAEKAHTILSDPRQRRTYDETLALAQVQPEPNPDAFGAELFFQEGQLRLRNRNFDGAVQALEAAARAQPGQPDYHAALGWALFLAHGRGEAGAMAARPHLDEALRIAPDSASVHELAGHVELDVHAYEQAADHFKRALRTGAPRMDLFEHLKDILARLERFKDLEHQYRQLILRLRDSDPLATLPLWLDLADLYLYRLGQPDNARVALKVAAKMVPHDPRVLKATASLTADAADWRQHASSLRQRYLAAPDDPAPLRELVRLHLAGGRTRMARDTLALLSIRGAANPDEEQLLLRLSSPELRRATRPFTATELAELDGGEPSAVVLDALAALAPVLGRLAPLTLESLGSSDENDLASDTLPRPFAAMLAYVCAELGVPQPSIYLSYSLANVALPLVAERPALVVGHSLLASEDEVVMAASLAVPLSSLDPGRFMLMTRPIEDLKDIVLAGLSLYHPAMPVAAESRAAAWQSSLKATPTIREALSAPLLRLMEARRVNLSDARRATKRRGARIALVLGNDPRAILPLLQADPELGLRLAEFVLGEDYEEIRGALGLLT